MSDHDRLLEPTFTQIAAAMEFYKGVRGINWAKAVVSTQAAVLDLRNKYDAADAHAHLMSSQHAHHLRTRGNFTKLGDKLLKAWRVADKQADALAAKLVETLTFLAVARKKAVVVKAPVSQSFSDKLNSAVGRVNMRRNPDGGAPAWYVARTWQGKYSNWRTAAEAKKAAGSRGTVSESAHPVSFDGSPLKQPSRASVNVPTPEQAQERAAAREAQQQRDHEEQMRQRSEAASARREGEDSNLKAASLRARADFQVWWAGIRTALGNPPETVKALRNQIAIVDRKMPEFAPDSFGNASDAVYRNVWRAELRRWRAVLENKMRHADDDDAAGDVEAKAKAHVQAWFNDIRAARGKPASKEQFVFLIAAISSEMAQCIRSEGASRSQQDATAWRARADAFQRLLRQVRAQHAEWAGEQPKQAYIDPESVQALHNAFTFKVNAWVEHEKAKAKKPLSSHSEHNLKSLLESPQAVADHFKTHGGVMASRHPSAFEHYRLAIKMLFGNDEKRGMPISFPPAKWAHAQAEKHATVARPRQEAPRPPPHQPSPPPKPIHNYFAGIMGDQVAIKKRYRELALKLHPDRGGNTREFQEMSAQYRALTPQTVNPHRVRRNPLRPGTTLSERIAQLIREGYPQKQAVAIAYGEQRAGKVKNPAPARPAIYLQDAHGYPIWQLYGVNKQQRMADHGWIWSRGVGAPGIWITDAPNVAASTAQKYGIPILPHPSMP